MTYTILGIDVSKYQASQDGASRFDWERAKKRVYFAYLRASVGAAGVDFQFYFNAQECRRLAIPFGIYHYLKPDKSWQRQAELFASLAVDAQAKKPLGQLPPALDVEEDGGLSKAALGSYLEKFVKAFETISGLSLVLYTSPGFWDYQVPLTNWAKNRKLWVANHDAAEPLLPKEWGECANPRDWTFWQFSCQGCGADYGSKGDDDIDLDWYRGDLAAFNAEFGLDVKPLEPDLPVEEGPVTRVRVSVPVANIRSEPRILASTDIGNLPKGTELSVLGESGAFWKVGYHAYIAKSVVEAVG